MKDEEIRRAVKSCVEQLYQKDGAIIAKNISELAITHRLAVYLEPHFRDYSVDVGYKGNCELGAPKPKFYQKGKYGIPDIVVHQRGSNNANLLVIEIKKENNHNQAARERDRIKLEALTDAQGMGYGFQLGLFLDIPINEGEEPGYTWYKNGQKKS